MRVLVKTNDPVLLSRVEALLSVAGVNHLVADRHISALEGAIGAFPRRLLVPDDEFLQARRLLTDDGLAAELEPLS